MHESGQPETVVDPGAEPSGGAEAEPPGVVVEHLADGSVLAGAGMEIGDVLLRWRRPPSPPANPDPLEGEIQTVFDGFHVQTEQAPRGTITFLARRGEDRRVFVAPQGFWGLRLRPVMEGDVLERYSEGLRLIPTGSSVYQGLTLWRELLVKSEFQPDLARHQWMRLRLGMIWAQSGRQQKAQKTLRSLLHRAVHPMVRWLAMCARAEVLASGLTFGIGEEQERRDFEKIEGVLDDLLEFQAANWNYRLQHAYVLHFYGLALMRRSLTMRRYSHRWEDAYDRERAEDLLVGALRSFEKWAPGSDQATACKHDLEFLHSLKIPGDESRELEARVDQVGRRLSAVRMVAGLFRGDVRIDRQELIASGLAYATVSNRQGEEATKDDPVTAWNCFNAALRAARMSGENSEHLAALHHLGRLALREPALLPRGPYRREQTMGYLDQAIELAEKLMTDQAELAGFVYDIATDVSRQDSCCSEHFLKRARRIHRAVVAPSLPLAERLNAFGRVAADIGDYQQATRLHQDALDIQEAAAPRGPEILISLNGLARLAEVQGELDLAEEVDRHALEIEEEIRPASAELAIRLGDLGRLNEKRRQLEIAENYFRRALETWDAAGADAGRREAFGHHNRLGAILMARGDLAAAEKLHRKALEAATRLAPGTLPEAMSRLHLGAICEGRGDLRQAERLYQKALRFSDTEGKLFNVSLFLAVRRARFYDSESAEQLDVNLARFKALAEKARAASQGQGAPNSCPPSIDLLLRSWIVRFDLMDKDYRPRAMEAVEGWLEGLTFDGDFETLVLTEWRSQALRRRQLEKLEFTIENLSRFCRLSCARGDLDMAEEYNDLCSLLCEARWVMRSLQVQPDPDRQARKPVRDPFAVLALDNFAHLCRARGEVEKVAEVAWKLLSYEERHDPESLEAAGCHYLLAECASGQGDAATARGHYDKALLIEDRLAPGSARLARTLHALASLCRQEGRQRDALRFIERALDARSEQLARLGGTDEQRRRFLEGLGHYDRLARELRQAGS